MKVVTSWADVPRFDSEDEEAAFWADARLDPRLMNAAIVKADAVSPL